MLKFFRHIRKKLLSQNKFSKYLIYAIGEIVLVVIGILLALQVNNWNESRKLKEVEKEYLTSLEEEFSYNLKEVDRVIQLNAKNIAGGTEFLKHFEDKKSELKETELSMLVSGTLWSDVQFRPSEGVLNEIISSGKLSIFSNLELKRLLSSWSGIMSHIRFQEIEHSNYRYKATNFIEENGNLRFMIVSHFSKEAIGIEQTKFKINNLKLLQSEKLEGYITGFIGTGKLLNGDYYYLSLKKEIEKILELIDQK